MGVDNGWAGIVVFGCVRDVEITADMDIGIRALAPYPVKSNKRSEGQRDIPIQLPGGQIEPGNHVYADENGVVVARADLGADFHD
jgi:regulator of ribonuclease activity A